MCQFWSYLKCWSKSLSLILAVYFFAFVWIFSPISSPCPSTQKHDITDKIFMRKFIIHHNAQQWLKVTLSCLVCLACLTTWSLHCRGAYHQTRGRNAWEFLSLQRFVSQSLTLSCFSTTFLLNKRVMSIEFRELFSKSERQTRVIDDVLRKISWNHLP